MATREAERYRCWPVNSHVRIVGPPLSNTNQSNVTTAAVVASSHAPACRTTTPPAMASTITMRRHKDTLEARRGQAELSPLLRLWPRGFVCSAIRTKLAGGMRSDYGGTP